MWYDSRVRLSGVPDGQLQLIDLGVDVGASRVIGLLLEAVGLVAVAGLDALPVGLDGAHGLVQLVGVLPRFIVEAVTPVVLRGRYYPDVVCRRRLVLVSAKEQRLPIFCANEPGYFSLSCLISNCVKHYSLFWLLT